MAMVVLRRALVAVLAAAVALVSAGARPLAARFALAAPHEELAGGLATRSEPALARPLAARDARGLGRSIPALAPSAPRLPLPFPAHLRVSSHPRGTAAPRGPVISARSSRGPPAPRSLAS
jgi:hypothetical protein